MKSTDVDFLIIQKKKEIMKRLCDFLRCKDKPEKEAIYKDIQQLEVELDELKERT